MKKSGKKAMKDSKIKHLVKKYQSNRDKKSKQYRLNSKAAEGKHWKGLEFCYLPTNEK